MTVATEAAPSRLTTQKSCYVEISRTRHRTELVTDDRKPLGQRPEADAGERVAALEAVGPAGKGAAAVRARAASGAQERQREAGPRDAPEILAPKAIEAGMER